MAFFVGMVGGKMEIITLLKSNIRHKKGSFLSITILMIIVAMSITSIISTKDNVSLATQNELERLNAPNLLVYMRPNQLTDDLLISVEELEFTDYVTIRQSVELDRMTSNVGDNNNLGFFQSQVMR